MNASLFTIPAGVPFGETLAAELLRRAADRPDDLARMRVLLPTRRACRALRQNFLQLTNGRPLLLPRLQPLSDVDAEELDFDIGADAGDDGLAIPPAIDPLRRQALLARLVMRRADFRGTPAHALALAGDLARLIDRVHTENLDLRNLAGLAGEEFAAHWQTTVEFLAIVSDAWPAILAEEGVIDPADRRNRLLRAQAAAWKTRPPQTPVIAAGVTGSIPAAAALLQVIASLPHGSLILPGLDRALDAESWDAIDDSHPQAALKELLARLDITRDAVQVLSPAAPLRAWLARELTRPAATISAWAAQHGDPSVADRARAALDGLASCDADTPEEEAQVIALILRETLETSADGKAGRTAALVTPDRDLARRVAAICRRWDLTLDDSAGVPLVATPVGIFLRLVAQAAAVQFTPAALLALLRHDFCRLQLPAAPRAAAIGALEMAVLRGARPPPGLAGLRQRAAPLRNAAIDDLLSKIEQAFAPLLALDRTPDFAASLDAHLHAAESLAAMPDAPGGGLLWSGEAGEAASAFLSGLRDQAQHLPALAQADYLPALEQLVSGVTVRPVWGTHPRLSILGRLEARLLQADTIILGGLNEGVWPPDPGHDPWMSRPMMAAFGLPAPEQAVGFAAHDFVQGFCAANVVMTRSRRAGGAPTVPARWLQRLDAVLEAAGLKPQILADAGRGWLALARTMDHAAIVTPAARPQPRPPVALRPRGLSATAIETWLSDPYQIYAKHILGLRKLAPLEQQPDAAERGKLLHAVMRDFVAAVPRALPPDAYDLLLAHGRARIAQRTDDPGFWDFWWPRFERIADWTVRQETEWRPQIEHAAVEIDGNMIFAGPAGDWILTARADRIDRMRDGTYALIDYKSGGQYSAGKIASGAAPQLPLEALILMGGGFAAAPPAPVSSLAYWRLTGGNEAGKIFAQTGDIPATLQAVRCGLQTLIDLFDDPQTPYLSVPDADRAPRYNDYAQLARLPEWTALGAAEDAA